jgi:septation ring formation regulator EzrA
MSAVILIEIYLIFSSSIIIVQVIKNEKILRKRGTSRVSSLDDQKTAHSTLGAIVCLFYSLELIK